ncbi:T9SS type A sorting domain-containing protein [Maribellus mangrovi]|uniref:T9SS type A sorting domain-containing protein n=1 Tax=Maribellus mangrovi TaxID=3133146 RepID=UPI0030ECDB2E
MKTFLSIAFVLAFGQHIFGQVKELIWEDNFNTGQLNPENWNIETGTGVNGDWGTGQLDRATDRQKNISFLKNVPGAEDACLVITTQKEFYIDRNYTSGRINTAGKKSWGPGHRIVAKVYPLDVRQMGQGFAFWMMPDEIPSGWNYIMWPQGGEIDIMEYVGSIPFHNLGSVHYAWFWQDNQYVDWNHGHQGAYYSYAEGEVPDPAEPGYGDYPPSTNDPNAGSSGFHEYGIDWYADRMEFFVDDNVYHIHYLNDGGAYSKDGEDQFTVKSIAGRRVGVSEYSNHFPEWRPFEHKMYAILSAGVGGSDYTYGGPIVPEADFPCSVYIDWIRVYKLDVNVGIKETAQNFDFQFYPNPASDKLTVDLFGADQELISIQVIDIQGRVLKELHAKGTRKVIIDLKGMTEGNYLLSVSDKKSKQSKRFMLAGN